MKTCARVIRRIVASQLIVLQQLVTTKRQMRIRFERYDSFTHHCLLSCRYVMFQILSKPKWGQGPLAPRSDDTTSNTMRCSRR